MSVPRDRDGLDASRPSAPRIYDSFLSGKDNYGADRDEAARVEAVFGAPAAGHLPVPQEMALRNRLFLDRAVSWASRQGGVRQFLDLGCGFPVGGRVIATPGGDGVTLRGIGEAAADGGPARVVYADIDQVAVTHVRALAADGGDVRAVAGDLADPASILGNPDVRACVDLRRPVCLVFGWVLQSWPPEQARAITGAWLRAAAPGSVLVISCPRIDDERLAERAREAFTAAPQFANHTRAEVVSFFTGTEILPPGVVPVRGWSAGWAACLTPDGPAYMLGGVGVRP